MSAHFSSCRSRFSGYLSLLNSHLSVLPHLLRIHSHGLLCSLRTLGLHLSSRASFTCSQAAPRSLSQRCCGWSSRVSRHRLDYFFFVPSSSWFFYIGLYDTFMIFSISKYMEEMKPCSNSSVNRIAYTFFIRVQSSNAFLLCSFSMRSHHFSTCFHHFTSVMKQMHCRVRGTTYFTRKEVVQKATFALSFYTKPVGTTIFSSLGISFDLI
jgi:hypothetical protein